MYQQLSLLFMVELKCYWHSLSVIPLIIPQRSLQKPSSVKSCFLKNFFLIIYLPCFERKYSFYSLSYLIQCTCWWNPWETVTLYLVTDEVHQQYHRLLLGFGLRSLNNSWCMYFLKSTGDTGPIFLPFFVNIP